MRQPETAVQEALVPKDPRAVRGLLSSTAISGVGNGIFATVAFLYYLEFLHLDPVLVGTLLTATGLLAVAVSFPAGKALEPVNPWILNAVLLLCLGVGVVGLLLAGPGILAFVFIAVIVLFSKLRLSARSALILLVSEGGSRARIRAASRAITNISMAVGGGAAALLIGLGGRSSYGPALWGVVGLYLVAALVLMAYAKKSSERTPPHQIPEATTSEISLGSTPVHRNSKFVLISLLAGFMAVFYLYFEVGMPIWVNSGPERASWIVGAAVGLNAVIVGGFQITVGRRVDSQSAAVKAVIVGSALVFLSTAALFASYSLTGIAQWTVVLVGVLFFSFGEVSISAGTWELAFADTPSDRPLEYQSFYSSWVTLGAVTAPALISLVLKIGAPGWLILGAFTLVVGAAHLVLRKQAPNGSST